MKVNVLLQVDTLEELREVAGELTDADRDLIASLNLFDPPTDEELAVLGPDFVERIINRTIGKISADETVDPSMADVEIALKLLAVLNDLEGCKFSSNVKLY